MVYGFQENNIVHQGQWDHRLHENNIDSGVASTPSSAMEERSAKLPENLGAHKLPQTSAAASIRATVASPLPLSLSHHHTSKAISARGNAAPPKPPGRCRLDAICITCLQKPSHRVTSSFHASKSHPFDLLFVDPRGASKPLHATAPLRPLSGGDGCHVQPLRGRCGGAEGHGGSGGIGQ